MKRFGLVLVSPFSDPNIRRKGAKLLDAEYQNGEDPKPPKISASILNNGGTVHTKVPWTSSKE
jgi:hypothetical protein